MFFTARTEKLNPTQQKQAIQEQKLDKTKINTYKEILTCKDVRTAQVCANHCAQLEYTTLIIFPLIFQTSTRVQTLSTGGEGQDSKRHRDIAYTLCIYIVYKVAAYGKKKQIKIKNSSN